MAVEPFCPDCVKLVAPDATSCPLCGKQLSVVGLANEAQKRSWYNRPYGCAGLFIVIMLGFALISGTLGLETLLGTLLSAAIIVLVLGLFYWLKDKVTRRSPP